MDIFRWILLAVGVGVVLVVYLWTRWQSESRARDYHRRDVDLRLEPTDFPDPLVDDVHSKFSVPIQSDKTLDPVLDVQDEPLEPEQVLIDEAQAHESPETVQVAPILPSLEEEKVVVFYLVAPKGRPFTGSTVQKIFADNHLEYGDMSIFHRLQTGSSGKNAVFSIASLVEPGTFDPQTMSGMKTPGLSLFMRLPGPVDGIKAFDDLVSTAKNIAGCLDGELRDETHSALGQQTIEHMREDIIDYQHRQRLSQVRI